MKQYKKKGKEPPLRKYDQYEKAGLLRKERKSGGGRRQTYSESDISDVDDPPVIRKNKARTRKSGRKSSGTSAPSDTSEDNGGGSGGAAGGSAGGGPGGAAGGGAAGGSGGAAGGTGGEGTTRREMGRYICTYNILGS